MGGTPNERNGKVWREYEDFFFFFPNKIELFLIKLWIYFFGFYAEVCVASVQNWLNDADLHSFCSWQRVGSTRR